MADEAVLANAIRQTDSGPRCGECTMLEEVTTVDHEASLLEP